MLWIRLVSCFGITACCLLGTVGCAVSEDPASNSGATQLLLEGDDSAKPSRTLEVKDIDGTSVRPLAPNTTQLHVVLFVSPWCPIVNSYAPTLKRIEGSFAQVRWFLVHSDPDVTLDEARAHREEYALPGHVLRDPNQAIRQALSANVTPEAFVVDASGVRYRGRIDDLYVDFGKRRAAPTRHYLRDALTALSQKADVPLALTEPLGCDIPDPK